MRALLLLGCLVLAGPALAADRALTLMFTGDNGGEIATCGCRVNPTGGLARRKTVVEKARAAGPVLVLDAGNALFKGPGSKEKDRAELILKAMGQLGTAAMAAGARDLTLGAQFLKVEAGKAKVPVLSANLLGPDKKPFFPPSTVTTVGELKVGLVGASPMGAFDAAGAGPVVTGEPPVKAALAEAKRLRPTVDLVVVLAAVPFADALQLSKEGGKDVDFVLQSHDGRGVGVPLKGEANYVIPTGERGRQVGSLSLKLSGKGPFVDLAEAERQKERVGMLERQVEEVKRRHDAATDAEVKKALKATLAQFEAQRAEAAKSGALDLSKAGRTLKLEFVALGADIKDDPALKAQIDKLEPPATPGH